MKRLFDITAALVALLLLCLPLLALTLLVAAKLGRPAFFRQVRPGLHGKPSFPGSETLMALAALDNHGSHGSAQCANRAMHPVTERLCR